MREQRGTLASVPAVRSTAARGCMIDALRQASLALSESELLFGEGLSALEPLRDLEKVKSALSQALVSSATDSPQALSTLHTGSMPSQCVSSPID